MTVHMTHTDAPVDSIEILLLPVDVQAILDSLNVAAREPRPEFEQLERELWQYRPANQTAVDSLRREWARARRGVELLADSLSRLPRESAAYDEHYRRFRDLYIGLSKEERAFEIRFRELVGDARDLATRAAAASDSLRRWERVAYAPIDSLLVAAAASTDRQDTILFTDQDGRVSLELRPGRWWIVARVPHPENPFLEYYWNVPFVVNPLVPVAVPATERQALERWRH